MYLTAIPFLPLATGKVAGAGILALTKGRR